MQPWNTLLLAEVTIPASTRSGRFDVTITCRTGSTATASVTINNAAAATTAPAPATRGPNTGGGFLARHGGAATASSSLFHGPAAWFGVGLVALLAAAAIGLRSRRMSRAAVRARPRRPVPAEQPVTVRQKEREITR